MGGKQLGFDDYEQSTAKKHTKRKKFLARMEQVVPCQPLIDLIVPFYPKIGFKGASADGAVGGVVHATSTGRQALQLCLQALPKAVLHQRLQRSSTRSLSALQMVRTPSRSQLTRPARCSWPSWRLMWDWENPVASIKPATSMEPLCLS